MKSELYGSGSQKTNVNINGYTPGYLEEVSFTKDNNGYFFNADNHYGICQYGNKDQIAYLYNAFDNYLFVAVFDFTNDELGEVVSPYLTVSNSFDPNGSKPRILTTDNGVVVVTDMVIAYIEGDSFEIDRISLSGTVPTGTKNMVVTGSGNDFTLAITDQSTTLINNVVNKVVTQVPDTLDTDAGVTVMAVKRNNDYAIFKYIGNGNTFFKYGDLEMRGPVMNETVGGGIVEDTFWIVGVDSIASIKLGDVIEFGQYTGINSLNTYLPPALLSDGSMMSISKLEPSGKMMLGNGVLSIANISDNITNTSNNSFYVPTNCGNYKGNFIVAKALPGYGWIQYLLKKCIISVGVGSKYKFDDDSSEVVSGSNFIVKSSPNSGYIKFGKNLNIGGN